MDVESKERRTSQFGATGMRISRVGLGAWAIGGDSTFFGWGRQSDAESVKAIHAAVARGVNWIDTAPVYGLGHSEELVGMAVGRLAPDLRPHIFTKCGMVWDPRTGRVKRVGRPDSVRREVEDSLRRLAVDRIELLQLHWPPHDGTALEDTWGAMIGLRDAGLVQFIGVSNCNVAELNRIAEVGRIDTVQCPLSLINRSALDDVLPWCVRHGAGVIVYSPMQSGILTGKYTAASLRGLDANDWRRKADDAYAFDFQPPHLARNLAFVEQLRVIAADVECTLPELAVAWTLAQPGVTGAIVGARHADQVDGWVSAPEVQLPSAAHVAIAQALRDTGAGRASAASEDGADQHEG